MYYLGLMIGLCSLGFFYVTSTGFSLGHLIHLPSLISLILLTVGLTLASTNSELLENLYAKDEKTATTRRQARIFVLKYAVTSAWIGGVLLSLIIIMNDLYEWLPYPISPMAGIPLLYTFLLAEFVLRPWVRRLENEK
jgi:hypothetical protein